MEIPLTYSNCCVGFFCHILPRVSSIGGEKEEEMAKVKSEDGSVLEDMHFTFCLACFLSKCCPLHFYSADICTMTFKVSFFVHGGLNPEEKYKKAHLKALLSPEFLGSEMKYEHRLL